MKAETAKKVKRVESLKREDPEKTYGRDNGSELGPVGLVMLGVIFVALCPSIAWAWFKQVLKRKA